MKNEEYFRIKNAGFILSGRDTDNSIEKYLYDDQEEEITDDAIICSRRRTIDEDLNMKHR